MSMISCFSCLYSAWDKPNTMCTSCHALSRWTPILIRKSKSVEKEPVNTTSVFNTGNEFIEFTYSVDNASDSDTPHIIRMHIKPLNKVFFLTLTDAGLEKFITTLDTVVCNFDDIFK